MAEKACHAFASTTQFGLTQALGGTQVTKFSKIALTAGLFVIAVIVGKYVGNVSARSELNGGGSENSSSPAKATQQQASPSLQELANGINERLPIDDGQGSIMERVAAGPGKMLTIHYKISVLRSNEIDSAMRDSIRSSIVSSRCDPGPIGDFLRTGIDVVAVYTSSDNVEVLRVLSPAGSCAP